MCDHSLMFTELGDEDSEKSFHDFSGSESEYIPSDLSSPILPDNYCPSDSESDFSTSSPVSSLIQEDWDQPSTLNNVRITTQTTVNKLKEDTATDEKNVVGKKYESVRFKPTNNYKYRTPRTYCSNSEVQ